MAVDTEAKRQSALHYERVSVPVPDGTIGLGDRAQLSRLYSGLAYSVATTFTDPYPRFGILDHQTYGVLEL